MINGYIIEKVHLEGGRTMRIVTLILVVLMLVATCAFAGGDKNHGDKGQGSVVQVVGP